jgi:hypothetical protein
VLPEAGTDVTCPRVVPERVTGPFIDLGPPAKPPSISTKHGHTGPSMTEFVNYWNPELMGELFPLWEARSLLAGSLVEVDELIRVVDMVLRCGATAIIPLGGGDPQKRTRPRRTAGLPGWPD